VCLPSRAKRQKCGGTHISRSLFPRALSVFRAEGVNSAGGEGGRAGLHQNAFNLPTLSLIPPPYRRGMNERTLRIIPGNLNVAPRVYVCETFLRITQTVSSHYAQRTPAEVECV
jgi:hypothetical protein